MTALEVVVHPSAAARSIHDSLNDNTAFTVGKAGGLSRGLDVGAFGGVVGFISHQAPPVIS